MPPPPLLSPPPATNAHTKADLLERLAATEEEGTAIKAELEALSGDT